MTMTIAQPTVVLDTAPVTDLANAIANRAMLVDLTIHQWTAVTRDRGAEKVVADHHQTAEDDGRYLKKLGTGSRAGKVLLAIRAKVRQLDGEHRRRTSPWRDGGTRILTSTGYFDYVATIRRLTAEYDALCDEFEPLYPSLIDEDRIRLKGLFVAADYPSPSRIRSKFHVTYHVAPVPQAGHLMIDLPRDELEKAMALVDASVAAGVAGAMADAAKRVQVVVGRMVERLTAYNDTGDKVVGVFRDSLTENVARLVEVLPSLNVAADPDFDAVVDRMRTDLLRYDPVALREDPEARKSTADAALEIIKAMSDFV